MGKYPKTITYEDLSGNEKSVVVNNEFEQRVLENSIEEQMKAKAELEVASNRFNYEMDALKQAMKGKSKEEQFQEEVNKLKEKKEELRKEFELKTKKKEEAKAQAKAQAKARTEEWDRVTKEKWGKLSPFQKLIRFIILTLILFAIFYSIFYFFVFGL